MVRKGSVGSSPTEGFIHRNWGVAVLRPEEIGIDARRVVAFRGELLAAGVGVHSVVKNSGLLPTSPRAVTGCRRSWSG
jgi:hypothetical protein